MAAVTAPQRTEAARQWEIFHRACHAQLSWPFCREINFSRIYSFIVVFIALVLSPDVFWEMNDLFSEQRH